MRFFSSLAGISLARGELSSPKLLTPAPRLYSV
jgi:hypothetical protein